MPSVSLVSPDPLPLTRRRRRGRLSAARRTGRGSRPARRGRRRGARRTAARRPRERLGATGKADEVAKLATLGLADFPLVVGHRARATTRTSPRRCAGRSARRCARSPAHARVHIAIDGPAGALAEGALLGAYTFTAYKSTPPKRGAAHGHDRRRTTAAKRAELKRARRRRRRRAPAPATWSTRRRTTCTRETFAARADELAAAARARRRGAGRAGAQARQVRRHPRRRAGHVRPPRLVRHQLPPGQGPRRQRRAGRQGHHVRLRRPQPQDGEHGLDEVRHGRRGRGHRGDAAPSPRSSCRSRSPRRCRWPRTCRPARRTGRRTSSPCATAAPSRSPTPTPRAGSCWPTRSPARSRTSPTT